MATVLVLLLAAARPALASAGSPSEAAPTGPVPLRILGPLHLLSYQLTPQAAEPLPEGGNAVRLELSESNVLHCPHLEPRLFEPTLDFEMSRLQVGFRRGLGGGWEAGVEVPLLYYHSGFLDQPIFEVEEAVGKIKPQRNDEIPGGFHYRVGRAGETLFAGAENQVGLGDVAFTIARSLGEARGWRPSVVVRGALKIPTGDRDRAFGNGIPEVGLGLAADWRQGRWSLRTGGGVTFPVDQVDRTPGLTSVPVVAGYGELSYHRGPRLAFHLQGAAQSGPFRLHGRLEPGPSLPKTDRSLTHHVFQVAPAVSWSLEGDRTLFVGLVEDVHHSSDSAADLTLFAVLATRF